MKKQTSFSTSGQRADIGNINISRILPNRYADKIGPFVFLDHILPGYRPEGDNNGTGSHPHRGIATLTYVINGEVEHFDSRGNHQKVHSGGIQWMKAGTGIVHDESLNIDANAKNNQIHALQFWINLPAKIKAEAPEYQAIESLEIPVFDLPNNGGSVKIIAGQYQNLTSSIPAYSKEFLYHIQLTGGGSYSMPVAANVEVAAFLPGTDVILNDVLFRGGEFIEFDRDAGEITMENNTPGPVDIILFGGDQYSEPVVAEGPFVMNTALEIAQAYRDFYAGKYGTIETIDNDK